MVFKDGNPAAPPEARFKAIGGHGKPRAYQSADGVHWKMVADRALVSKGTFDSQNIAFWDAARNTYRLYWRINPESVRGIRTAASTDFVKFVDEADLTYPGKTPADDLPYLDRVQLYTNAVQPYARAPHLFVGFPTQFIQKGKQTPPKFYQTQPLFMSSRDGVEFKRWDEPVIPTTAPKERDGNRGNYMAWGMLQLPDNPREISVYATEGGPRLRAESAAAIHLSHRRLRERDGRHRRRRTADEAVRRGREADHRQLQDRQTKERCASNCKTPPVDRCRASRWPIASR